VRLSNQQQRIIREEAQAVFGPTVEVRIFGSRLDDGARGGDIDIHVETQGDVKERLNRELRLYARLQRRLGERSMDIVVHDREQPMRDIDRHALATGVRL